MERSAGDSSNGRTADSGSVGRGSNPRSPANSPYTIFGYRRARNGQAVHYRVHYGARDAQEDCVNLDARVSERVDALVKKGDAVLLTERKAQPSSAMLVDDQRYAEWRSQALACLEQVLGPTHTYTKSFASEAEGGRHYSSSVKRGLGILHAALEDVEHGYLDSVQQPALVPQRLAALVDLTLGLDDADIAAVEAARRVLTAEDSSTARAGGRSRASRLAASSPRPRPSISPRRRSRTATTTVRSA